MLNKSDILDVIAENKDGIKRVAVVHLFENTQNFKLKLFE